MTHDQTRNARATMVVFTLVLSSLGAAPSALAQDTDPRWHPWLGCWQLWEEQLDPSALTETRTASDETAALLDRTSVCVRPGSSESEVDLTAVARNQVLVERTLVADGTRREIQEPECVGWEQSEWSFDGRRLFTHAELRCGDDTPRTITGVSLLTSSSVWVDIQVVDFETRQLVEVRRYTPVGAGREATWLDPGTARGVDPNDIRQARRESAAPLDLRDIEEASRKTTPRVVETLLVETEPRLPLDSETLIALDNAGISGGVIDLLVGLSYPDHFVVERRDRSGSWSSRPFSGFGGFHDPMWYDRYYPYYITPLGHYSWGRGYNPYLFGAVATPFVVVPTTLENDVGRARAVDGQGYTRVAPRVTTPRVAMPRGGSASPGGYTSGGNSGGGTSSGTGSGGSSGGASRGGTSSGRQAVPRR